VHVLVVGGEVLDQQPQPGIVGLLREQGLADLRAELLQSLALPHLPQARGEVEDERLEEQQDDDPLVVAQVLPLRLAPNLGAHALGYRHGPRIGLVVLPHSAEARPGAVSGAALPTRVRCGGGGWGSGGGGSRSLLVRMNRQLLPAVAGVQLEYVGAHGPAVGLYVLDVLLLADAVDRIPKVLARRQKERAGEQDDHRALGVDGEDGVVDADRLELQILGERLYRRIHFFCLREEFLEDSFQFRSLCTFLDVLLFVLLVACLGLPSSMNSDGFDGFGGFVSPGLLFDCRPRMVASSQIRSSLGFTYFFVRAVIITYFAFFPISL